MSKHFKDPKKHLRPQRVKKDKLMELLMRCKINYALCKNILRHNIILCKEKYLYLPII